MKQKHQCTINNNTWSYEVLIAFEIESEMHLNGAIK